MGENASDPVKVLFVCMGNICRSPAAEAVFMHLAQDAGLADRIEVDSAGTIGYHAGEPADSRMRSAAKARGYELHSRARQISERDLQRFDLVLVMDQENLDYVIQLDPTGAFRDRIKLLCDYCQISEADEVPDPYYGGNQGFNRVLDILEDACEGLLEEVKKGKVGSEE